MTRESHTRVRLNVTRESNTRVRLNVTRESHTRVRLNVTAKALFYCVLGQTIKRIDVETTFMKIIL